MAGQLVLLCGKSFSGKSTVASFLAQALPGAVVSLDAINEQRGLWGGDGIPISEWARTTDLARDRVRTRVKAGETVIVDDSSSPRFLRDEWRSLAAAAGAAMVLVFVDAPDELIRHRLQENRARGRRGDVTDEVMAAHQESFEPPGQDEQHIRPPVEPGSADLDGLCTDVRRFLARSR